MIDIMDSNEMVNLGIEASLNELLDNCLGYVENVLLEEEIMNANQNMI